MNPDHKRLTLALLLSLLLHALLLSLTLSGQGHWFPGFGLPWQDRRVEAPELRVAVVPVRITAADASVARVAEPAEQAPIEKPAAGGRGRTPSSPAVPIPWPTAVAILPQASPQAGTTPPTDVPTGEALAQVPQRADRPGDKPLPPIPAPAVIAVTPTDEASWAVRAAPPIPSPVIAEEPTASSPGTVPASLPDAGDATRTRIDHPSTERSLELTKVDPVAQEGQRVVEQLNTPAQESVRQENVRAPNARLEADRQEAARAEVAGVEAARVEAAQVEAAQVEAARIEAARIEAARIEAARGEAAKEAAARREATLRAIGRQLDEEAARREAATRLAPSSSGARRYRLFGRSDPNAELILYVEAWSRKIHLNMTFDMVREAAKQPHADPVVTVAIRSDGSVESVTFVQSSGVPALDDAIRRVVHSQTPFQAFPPALAREYDVIEIRRTWYFDMAIRLY